MSKRGGRHGRYLAVVLSGVAFMWLGDLWAQGSSAAADTAAAPGRGMTLGPSQLVATLHQVNRMEIAAGQAAQKRGSDRAIREYGRDLVLDHQTADDDITAYARSNGIAMDDVPAGVKEQQQQFLGQMDKLRKLSGRTFDHQFALDVAHAYEDAIATIEASRSDVRDQVLVVLLDTLEPTLRKHHLMAEDIVFGNVASNEGSSANAPQRRIDASSVE